MQTHSGARALYDSPLHALRTIAREEGVLRGLYRGLALNWLKTAPNVSHLHEPVRHRESVSCGEGLRRVGRL